jgi:cyclohexa-1,5-dienecarbonyl-CoA hydratase
VISSGGTAGFRTTLTAGLLTIDLDRPPANVIDLGLASGIRSAIQKASAAGGELLLLRGEGRHFCAGVDIADHIPERIETMLRSFHGLIQELLDFPGVTVACVQGACLGGGLEVALACDLVVVADDAQLGFPEIDLACFPPVAATWLPDLVGTAAAADWILTGRRFSGREALARGLVCRSVPARELSSEGRRLVEGLQAKSRSARAAALGLLRRPKRLSLSEAEEAYRRLSGSEDLRRAVARYLAARPAKERRK